MALKKQIQALDLSPGRLHLLGFQKNLSEWLAASDVFVLPSKLPEPNATVLIAAMATGLPCIGTNIGGTVETIVDGESGLLVPPDDPQALASAMVTLAEDRNLREAMGRAGLQRAKTVFSLDHYCQTIMESYER